jgi:hypothetical protein
MGVKKVSPGWRGICKLCIYAKDQRSLAFYPQAPALEKGYPFLIYDEPAISF